MVMSLEPESIREHRKIQNALLADMLRRRPGRAHSIREIADYTGISKGSLQNIEEKALLKLKDEKVFHEFRQLFSGWVDGA